MEAELVGRRDNLCKGPEPGVVFAYWRNSKKVSVAEG